MPRTFTLTIPAAPPFSPSQGAETVEDEELAAAKGHIRNLKAELQERDGRLRGLEASLQSCRFANDQYLAEVKRLRATLAERDERLRLAGQVCIDLCAAIRRLEEIKEPRP